MPFMSYYRIEAKGSKYNNNNKTKGISRKQTFNDFCERSSRALDGRNKNTLKENM